MKVKRQTSVIAGVDLSVRRRSALSVLDLKERVLILKEVNFKDLLKELRFVDIVSVDSPLSYKPPFRDFEKKMISRGFRLLPLSLRGMMSLANLGRSLMMDLSFQGVAVLETHPSSAIKVAGPPDPPEGFECLIKLGKDLRDSLICLLTSYAFIRRKLIAFRGNDGILVLPGSETLWDDLFNEVSYIRQDDPRGACNKANKERN